jgi:uncharacterized repeat protein (TIGR03803 family)
VTSQRELDQDLFAAQTRGGWVPGLVAQAPLARDDHEVSASAPLRALAQCAEKRSSRNEPAHKKNTVPVSGTWDLTDSVEYRYPASTFARKLIGSDIGCIVGTVMRPGARVFLKHFLLWSAVLTTAIVPEAVSAGETTLYAFKESAKTGYFPVGGLFEDSSGNLYGTTSDDGAVFKLAPSGKLTVLASLDGNSYAGLVTDTHGNFYGTTFDGGNPNQGTVFKVTAKGKATELYDFLGGSDGASPYGPLLIDAQDNLYGTTYSGGGSANCSSGCGTVFKVTPGGKESVLYAFQGGADGAHPGAGLIADAQGNFYGTTVVGGGSCNCGTVFKIAPSGAETVLHIFTSGNDGAQPAAALIADAQGNLYGTTELGGSAGGGTVFKIASNGTESILHAFGQSGDGNTPQSPLLADQQGNLYGTTQLGGTFGFGTLYEVAPNGTETLLHQFAGGGKGDGAWPYAGLISDNSGNFYGATLAGGNTRNCFAQNTHLKGCGSIFKLTP